MTREGLTLLPHRAGLVTDEQVAWLNDPENVKFSEQRHAKHTLESQHRYLNDFPSGSHIWLIRRDDKDIGTITAYVDEPNKLANMGILIGRAHWGNGYGKSAWKCVMDFLEKVRGVTKIECGFMGPNKTMLKLATASGMSLDAVSMSHFVLNNKRVAKVTFAKET